jgi:hypothetical protein
MKSLKKAFRLVCLVLLIFLACFGVGLSGGIPTPFSGKRDEKAEINIEMVESEKDETDDKSVNFYE